MKRQPLKQEKKVSLRTRLHSPWAMWLLIVSLFTVFSLPYYVLPGKTLISLGSYEVLAIVPMVMAALLRTRKGSLVVSILLVGDLILHDELREHLPYKSSVMLQAFVGIAVVMLIGFVAGQLRDMSIVIKRLHRELKEANNFIQYQALADPLTKLPNHRAVLHQLEQEQARVSRSGDPLSVLFFDCDHFKRINELYGHTVGDMVLIALSERAQTVVRPTDTVGRYGGEEFVILLPATGGEQAAIVAERLRETIEMQPLATDENGNEVSVTVSVGISTFPDDDVAGIELLSKADHAMYWAKTHGRNRTYSFAQVLNARYGGLST